MHPSVRLTDSLASLTVRLRRDQHGFSTAELLANAALGIAALVVIWSLLQGLGESVVADVGRRLLGR